MRRLPLAAVVALAGLAGVARVGADDAPAPDRVRLATAVRTLAAGDLAGRGRPDDRERAAAWVVEALAATGAKPAPGRGSMALAIPARPGAWPAGSNVVGWIEGETAAEHVLVVTAYDGRPPAGAQAFPGADARATGVASMLEVARLLAAGPRPARSVMLAFLDLADAQDVGARALLATPPVATSRTVAVVATERLGRSLGDALPGTLFVFGAERGRGLPELVDAFVAPAGVRLVGLGADLHAEPTSVALPFEEASLPTLLVTAGASKDDGTPRDIADAVDVAALAANTRALADLVRGVADARADPAWVASPAPRIAEARALRAVVADVLARAAEAGGEDARRRILARELVALLDEAVARGTWSAGARVAARLLALQVFGGLVGRDR